VSGSSSLTLYVPLGKWIAAITAVAASSCETDEM